MTCSSWPGARAVQSGARRRVPPLQVEKVQPKSSQPAFLEVVDIAGLVKGAAEVGAGGAGAERGGPTATPALAAGCALVKSDTAGKGPPWEHARPDALRTSRLRGIAARRSPRPQPTLHQAPTPTHTPPHLQGAGLGNAFLSNIAAVDGIFHVCRAFDDADVVHVEDRVDPVEGGWDRLLRRGTAALPSQFKPHTTHTRARPPHPTPPTQPC